MKTNNMSYEQHKFSNPLKLVLQHWHNVFANGPQLKNMSDKGWTEYLVYSKKNAKTETQVNEEKPKKTDSVQLIGFQNFALF